MEGSTFPVLILTGVQEFSNEHFKPSKFKDSRTALQRRSQDGQNIEGTVHNSSTRNKVSGARILQ